MKNKRKTMVTAMLASIIMLIAAGFANAASISGYMNFKDGVRNALNHRNVTTRFTYYVTVDGVTDENSREEYYIKADLDNGMTYENNNGFESYNTKISEDRVRCINISQYNGKVSSSDYRYRDKFDSLYYNTQPEMIRVVEILADALSGNAKDYFFTNEKSGNKTVTAKLNKEQVPEIVNALIDLATSSSRSYNYFENGYTPDPTNTPFEELDRKISHGFVKQIDVKEINITAEMDKNNNITLGKLEGLILITDNNNDTNELVLTVDYTAEDIGTTTIVIPDEVLEKASKN